MSSRENVTKFLQAANKSLKRKYGSDVLYAANDLTPYLPFETGFPGIDWLVSGIGGLPRGGLTLVTGIESSGKTSFVLETCRNHIQKNPDCNILYIDCENALDKTFFQYKQMPSDNFTISSMNTSEDVFTTVKDALKEKIFDAIVIDSLAKMDGEKVIDADIGETVQRNRRAFLLTEFLRKISFILRDSGTALITINQYIQNQDTYPGAPKHVLPGGMQQKYSANLHLDIKRTKNLKNSEGVQSGFESTFTASKNKISPNEKMTCVLKYLYNRGFLREVSLLDYLIACGVVRELSAARYEFVDKAMYYPEIFKIQKFIEEVISWTVTNKNIDLYDVRFDIKAEIQNTKAVDDTQEEDA